MSYATIYILSATREARVRHDYTRFKQCCKQMRQNLSLGMSDVYMQKNTTQRAKLESVTITPRFKQCCKQMRQNLSVGMSDVYMQKKTINRV